LSAQLLLTLAGFLGGTERPLPFLFLESSLFETGDMSRSVGLIHLFQRKTGKGNIEDNNTLNEVILRRI
jgi:hypothetical protein